MPLGPRARSSARRVTAYRPGPAGLWPAAGAVVIMVAAELVAIRAGALGYVIMIALGGASIAFAVLAGDLVRIGVAATIASAFTLTWNGWFIGPLQPGDVLPLIALACFALGAPTRAFVSPPWWIKQIAFSLLLLLFLLVVFPTSAEYLGSRLTLGAGGEVLTPDVSDLSFTNVAIAAKFIVAVAVVPVCFAAAALVDNRSVRRLGIAFCTGAAVSAFAALVDHLGVASIGQILTGLPPDSDRELGFANHPNFLAEAVVIAAPFACWLLASRSRIERRIGAVSLVSLLGGVYASGSRGGSVAIVIAILLAFLLLPRSRAQFPAILLGAAATAGVFAVVFPSAGLAILRVTRLYGNPNTTGSDLVRERVAAQARLDFDYSPFKGIGLQASTDASQVYLQELAAGGLVLFVAMQIYMLGATWSAFRLINDTPIAAACCASIVSIFSLNFVQASLTDRFYYLPIAILTAVVVTARRTPNALPPRDSVDAGSEDRAVRIAALPRSSP